MLPMLLLRLSTPIDSEVCCTALLLSRTCGGSDELAYTVATVGSMLLIRSSYRVALPTVAHLTSLLHPHTDDRQLNHRYTSAESAASHIRCVRAIAEVGTMSVVCPPSH